MDHTFVKLISLCSSLGDIRYISSSILGLMFKLDNSTPHELRPMLMFSARSIVLLHSKAESKGVEVEA